MSEVAATSIGSLVDPRARLLDLLSRLAKISSKEMALASGRTSNIYFDMKMAMFDPEAIDLIADDVLARVWHADAQLIGGLELGAVPIIAAVVCKSARTRPIRGFFVRKTVNAHGTQKKIDGHFDPRQRIVLLDDVTTSGGSVLEAVRAVREHGGTVATVMTIVDREEGASENLAREGITLSAMFTKTDFCH